MNSFQYLQDELEKIKDYETERSYYPILRQFLIAFAKESLKWKQDVNVISEASSKVHDEDVGFPDLTVQVQSYGYKTLGWIEVKLPKDNLNDDKFKEQFERYTDSLENVLFTNLREWTLYQWDDKGKTKKVASCLFYADDAQSDTKPLIEVLSRFFEGTVLEIKTPKQLALALARKTRLLSKQVQETLREALIDNNLSHDLVKLRNAFSETLIADLKDHQFANMAAETIAYSFFLAALEHQKRGKENPLTITTAIDYLPSSVPILGQLYDLFAKSASKNESVKMAVEALLEQFQKADMEKINNLLSKHEVGKDPVINFYEPFLAEYDPKEREARGVYYTPKQAVDYIVRGVDYILREKFNKMAGIADPEVHLLDPATGTGTFLMSAIELIYQQKQKQFGPIGEAVVRKEFIRVVENHILKHFYGFELMIAPYAIAHLKLTLLLEDLGFDFSLTKNNEKDDDDRLRIYLANTLEEPHHVEEKGTQLNLLGLYEAISDESETASLVKSKDPIMAVVGNPPYSGHSSNNGDWIRKLVKDYYFVDGKPLGEKNPKWLQDDYVKFIRFAQWKIEQTGEGVVGFITNHSYLDNPTFRGMRQQLMQHFNEIYVFDLHGNSLKKEKTPEGGKDDNIFNIQAGVAIVFLVKQKGVVGCKVFRSDLYGLKADKLAFLEAETFENTKWEKIEPRGEFILFKKEDIELASENEKFIKINDVFLINGVGILTARDRFVIDDDKTALLERIKRFRDSNLDDEKLHQETGIRIKKGWSIRKAWQMLQGITDQDLEKLILNIDYRPFDIKWEFYHDALVWRTVKKIMTNMQQENVALTTCRQINSNWQHAFLTNKLVDDSFVSNKTRERGYVFALFLYKNEQKSSNISPIFIDKISKEIESNIDLDQTIHVFDYIYGILFLPTYRQRYDEQLKIDFPRIPLPSQAIEAGLTNSKDQKEAFNTISKFGTELRQLHLLTHPIFADSSKWGVQVGGNKPDGVEDWKVTKILYQPNKKRVYVNENQYFEGIDPEVWTYHIGGYQVLDKWLKDRKKAERCLSSEDIIHYCKIIVSIRETIKVVSKFS